MHAPEPEHVVLLDRDRRVTGIAPKQDVHGPDTPLHLGFSCYVVDGDQVLLTKRAGGKLTWPDVWSNACCGHPQLGETLRSAVARRLVDELGVTPTGMALALPGFGYRAVMDNGVVEHEVCPVVVAEIDGEPILNPGEVGDAEWVPWASLRARASTRPASLSPWSVEQLGQLPAQLSVSCRPCSSDDRLDEPIVAIARLPFG